MLAIYRVKHIVFARRIYRVYLLHQLRKPMPNQKASDVGDQLADPEYVSLIFRPIKIEQEGDLQNADRNDRQTDRHPRAR